MTLYAGLKLIHVISVIIWVGGTVQIAVLASLFSRDAVALGVLGKGGMLAGRYLLMPGSILTLLTGIALMLVVGGHPPFWMLYGFIAGPGSGIIGGVFIRKTGMALSQSMSSGATEDTVSALRQRLVTLTVLNVALQMSGVAMMVLKPAF